VRCLCLTRTLLSSLLPVLVLSDRHGCPQPVPLSTRSPPPRSAPLHLMRAAAADAGRPEAGPHLASSATATLALLLAPAPRQRLEVVEAQALHLLLRSHLHGGGARHGVARRRGRAHGTAAHERRGARVQLRQGFGKRAGEELEGRCSVHAGPSNWVCPPTAVPVVLRHYRNARHPFVGGSHPRRPMGCMPQHSATASPQFGCAARSPTASQWSGLQMG
jgi:hypothetical protein